jgi:ubiquinone/menaquinone biosynthesis C-methylase UbiE
VSREDTERLAKIYSAQARGYADSWGPVIRPMGERLLRALPWDDARRVIDVGTGAGTHLADIRRLAQGACVVGVDRSAGMLDLARHHGAPLVLMDGVELGFRDRSIDVAVMAFVLFHLDDPLVALREVRRVLHPGGAVGTVTWAEDPEIEASRVWEAELDAHGARDPVAPRPRRDELLNTPEKMIGLFSAAGLEPVKVWIEHFEHHWGLDELSLMHMTFGRSKRKLESLEASARAAFLARVRARLLSLPPEAFIYRAAVVCGVACRPA